MAGLQVVVLDQRPVGGGAVVTEEFSPGFSNFVASYAVTLLKGSSQNFPQRARFVMAPWSSSPGVYGVGRMIAAAESVVLWAFLRTK